jgi:hypothetical protein
MADQSIGDQFVAKQPECTFRGGELDGHVYRVSESSTIVISAEADPARSVYYERQPGNVFIFRGEFKRPSQDEVEAMAAQMFGSDWKTSIQRKIAELEGVIAWRLDQARLVVLRERER